MPIKRLSGACALAAALVLVAGCGSSGGSSTGGSSTGSSGGGSTSASTPSASPSPTATPATVAQLKKIVLQPADLPGWKASPAEPDPTQQADDAQMASCVGVKNTDEDQVATSDSDDFSLGDATISSSASSYKSPSDLDVDLAVLHSPKFDSCETQLMSKGIAESLPQGSRVGTMSLKITPQPGGDWPANVVGIGTASVPVTVNGQQVTLYADFAAITGPLIEADVEAENVGAPVPAAALRAAIVAVAHRAATGS